MILVSFSSAENALFNDVKTYNIIDRRVLNIRRSVFFGTPGIVLLIIWKWKDACLRIEQNAVKLERVLYQKSQELLSSWSRCMPHTKGYITRHWNWMNCYWMFWICMLPVVYGDRWAISVIFYKAISVILLESLLFLHPWMMNSNVVDFSECCCTEVISFFWRSVYMKQNRIEFSRKSQC